MNRQKEWRPIPGLEGRYAASNDGEIMSMDYRGTGIPGLLKPQVNRLGYAKVWVFPRRMTTVHSLVMLAFVGPRPYRMDINHINGIKTDNSVENLRYCTTAENMQHACDTGLKIAVHGEAHPQAKMNDKKVKEIRRLAKLSFTYKEIGELVGGLAQSTIASIIKGKSWKHVKDEEEA